MKQKSLRHQSSNWPLRALVLTVLLATVACGGGVKISPTQPEWPISGISDSNLGPRILDISGGLVAQHGSCFEATILYDGRELEGARVTCSLEQGCAKLRLRAEVNSEAGQHTVSFKVLRQSAEAVEYKVDGRVLVTREGLSIWQDAPMVLNFPLLSSGSVLRAGDSVTFDIAFSD